MLPGRAQPFPLEAVRDLLGLVRAMYRAKRDAGGGAAELERLAAIGRRLTLALELSAYRKGSMGERAAWAHADQAVEDLGNTLDWMASAEPILRAAQRAVSGGRRRRA